MPYSLIENKRINLPRAEFKDMSVASTCETTPVLGVAPSMYTSHKLAVHVVEYDQRFSHERFTIHPSIHHTMFLSFCGVVPLQGPL